MKKQLLNFGIALVCVASLFQSCQQKVENNNGEATATLSKETNSSEDKIALENKKIVLDFYQQMFGDKDLSAVDRYIADDYIQHNPTVADGAVAFKEAAKGWFEGASKTTVDVQRSAAEGDLVFVHIKNPKPDGSIVSTIDIFRLENGKIVEHWDVHQAVPEKAANDHPMF